VSMMSNYPPGVTDAVIDEWFGDDCYEDCVSWDEYGNETGEVCRCDERREELRAEGEAVAQASSRGVDY
jgi:hypothetical protein